MKSTPKTNKKRCPQSIVQQVVQKTSRNGNSTLKLIDFLLENVTELFAL